MIVFHTCISVSIQQKGSIKIDYCLYCDTEYKSNISKHYISMHSEEDEVVYILAIPKKSKRRKHLLKKLQNEGNFKHNTKVSYFSIQ